MKIYWTEGDELLGCWDEATSAITYAYYGNPELAPQDYSGYGSTAILGDGTVAVGRYHSSAGGNPVVYLYNPDLTFNSYKEMSFYDASVYSGYINYAVVSGVYDAGTGRNWFTFTKASEGYKMWTAYDNTMSFVESFRDVAVGSTLEGDTVYGATHLHPHNVYQRGRMLIRGMSNGSGFVTTELDTGVLKGALFDYANYRTWGGYDEAGDNFVVVNIDTQLFEIYSFASVSWHTYNPDTPNTTYLPTPDFTLNPAGSGGPANPMINGDSSGVVRIHQGWIYYWAQHTYNVDYGYDGSNQNYGNATALYRINIASGAIEKVFDVPYVSLDIYGNQFTDGNSPDWEHDNFSGNERGLSIVASATNIGQLYVNLSTTESTPNWVNVCNQGGTQILEISPTSVYSDNVISGGYLTGSRTPANIGNVMDGDPSTYATITALNSGGALYSDVIVAEFAPLPTGSTPTAMHMFMRARDSSAWDVANQAGIRTLYCDGLETAPFDDWIQTAGSPNQLGPLVGGTATSFADYRFYYLGGTGDPNPTTVDSQWSPVDEMGEYYRWLALTTNGLKVAFHVEPALGYADRAYLDIAEIKLVVALEGGALGHFNPNPTGTTWTQVHLGNFYANANPGNNPPTWYTCCSH